MITEHQIQIYRGDTFSMDVTLEQEDGMPIDTTNATFDMLIVPVIGEPIRPLITVNQNVVTIALPHEMTKDLKWRTAKYDLQMTQGEVVKTFLRGSVKIFMDVTP